MAANNAFCAALSALDPPALEKYWAHEPYIAEIAPRSKTIATGTPAIQDAFKNGAIAVYEQLTVKPVGMQVHINGNVAWAIGHEAFEGKTKDGTQLTGVNFASAVFEKKDGNWLMVLRHAHRVPQ
jgi:ketosteroid isomerase-like protein